MTEVAESVSAVADLAQLRVLTAHGYRSLRLGMGEAEAMATGLLTGEDTSGVCRFYRFVHTEGSQPKTSGVFISPTNGVVMIGGTSKMLTPQGVWRGSELADLRDAYPVLRRDRLCDWIYRAAAPGNPRAHYWFTVEGGRVTDFGLQASEL
ncbi:hypothetical protein JOF53_002579 [Crossiella equi]|uniref:Uncharacterized protein n=1 Tax=Crossiella equi TaxID=130796 RepID=A0ABS5AAU8_9PSEU|nr:hypothetical protein [Crossiella equi]MBP2473707.1 hypothetical protein [Crossiella equi]